MDELNPELPYDFHGGPRGGETLMLDKCTIHDHPYDRVRLASVWLVPSDELGLQRVVQIDEYDWDPDEACYVYVSSHIEEG